jgi:hypothetical protein
VTGAWNVNSKGTDWENYAGLNDIIIVKVSNLQELLNDSKCLDKDGKKKANSNCTEREIALYLDGREIKGLIPESGAPKVEPGTLQFHLKREVGKNDEIWADLLGAPPFTLGNRLWYRPTEISVGLENGYALPTDKKDFQIIRLRSVWFWVSLIGLILLIWALVRLAKRTDLLRDVGEVLPGQRKQYSLGRCQMAFWFVLVIVSFFIIWLVTGAMDVITPSVLGLIGIGAGTALGSAVIDVSKRGEIDDRLTSLQAERDALTNDVTALDAKIPGTTDATALNQLQQQRTQKMTRLNEVNAEIAKLGVAATQRPSAGFLSDLLKDGGSYSFHRLQMFVWTIVLGILFLHSVWSRVAMPDFDATLLALMGISSGTFLGFKIPGK